MDCRLYLITPPTIDDLAAFGRDLAHALDAGDVAALQVRLKGADEATIRAAIDVVTPICHARDVAVILNDDPMLAAKLGCDGVHIGQEDMDARTARGMIGPDMILGLSVETEALAAAVDRDLVDYTGVGPVFATPTKADHKQPIGFDGLARLVQVSPVPSVAIGGLKAEHVVNVLAAGASGLAVVSAVCGTPDPQAATRRIAAEIRKARA